MQHQIMARPCNMGKTPITTAIQEATCKAAKACKLQQNPITSARQHAKNPARLAQFLQTLLA